jgi:hypothetical protein
MQHTENCRFISQAITSCGSHKFHALAKYIIQKQACTPAVIWNGWCVHLPDCLKKPPIVKAAIGNLKVKNW